jgi:hypothetical protein
MCLFEGQDLRERVFEERWIRYCKCIKKLLNFVLVLMSVLLVKVYAYTK